jgi:hypothetical protein
MQMRSCAVWLSVLGLLAIANPASAAPKKKHSKAKHAQSAEPEPEVAPPAKESPKAVDDLMEESAKPKAKARAAAADTSEPVEKADDNAEVGEPDAWERPPAEEEKPKPKRVEKPEEKKGDGRQWEVGLLAGWGLTTSNAPFSQDPYRLGFGLRASYTFDFRMTVGLGYEYYLGSSITTLNPITQVLTKSTANYQWIHAEVGYDLWFDKVLFRPSLWLAVAIATKNPPLQSGTSGVLLSTVVAPGVELNYMLGDAGWYLGIDARFMFVIGTGSNAIPLLATFGKRF